MFCHGSVFESLMWTIPVVESYELLVDMIEVAEAETHEVVQAFSLDGADPCLGERVGVGRTDRRPQSTDAGILEHAIESPGVFRIAITEEEPRLNVTLV